SMSDAEAAAFLNVYQTSYVGLVHNGRMQPGDIVLVHGGAGGVGLAAIQIAKAKGCTVIATASSEEKLAACREQGADHVVNYAVEDFVQAVQEYTAGHGADIIYDPVGGDVFDQSRRCIAFGGRLVVVGFASGRIPEIAANRILLRNFSLTGFTLHGYKAHRPQVLADSHADLIQLHAAGQVKPVISHTLPMSRLVEGIELLETRRSIGKVVMVPGSLA
ncbi:MAG: zinc-binding dehydrogenase, partial [Candidatus Glassbacteria bacterium]|nr:zinc-binding dehydrogenase [Candidatus Glassbacteria bacterium]